MHSVFTLVPLTRTFHTLLLTRIQVYQEFPRFRTHLELAQNDIQLLLHPIDPVRVSHMTQNFGAMIDGRAWSPLLPLKPKSSSASFSLNVSITPEKVVEERYEPMKLLDVVLPWF